MVDGPNDFHIETVDGQIRLLAGLGPEYQAKPSDKEVAFDAASIALDNERAALKERAAAIVAAEAELEAKMAAIAAQQAELDAIIAKKGGR